MQRRRFVTLAAGIGLPFQLVRRASADGGWSLIEPDEMRRDMAAPHPHGLQRGLTLAPGGKPSSVTTPQIEIQRPDPERAVACPFSIELRFVPLPDAPIDPRTFRALYGWLELDITDRVLEHSHLTASGLQALNVNAPQGNHSVKVRIADTAGRVGSRILHLIVT